MPSLGKLLTTIDLCRLSCSRSCKAVGLGSRAAAACHAAREPVRIYHADPKLPREHSISQRSMVLGYEQTLQGVAYVSSDGSHDVTQIGLNYIKVMTALGAALAPKAGRVLCIGLGSGAIVHRLRECLPSTTVLDVVEINRSVIEAARLHCGFSLGRRQLVNVEHNDALCWLEQNQATYDIVFVDAYGADGSIPEHLGSAQFLEALQACLIDKPTSVVLANVTGQDKKMLAGVVTLYEGLFRVLQLEVPSFRYANHVLIASSASSVHGLNINVLQSKMADSSSLLMSDAGLGLSLESRELVQKALSNALVQQSRLRVR